MITTTKDLLAAALRVGEAHASTAVSTRHLAVSELVRVYRAMPPAERELAWVEARGATGDEGAKP